MEQRESPRFRVYLQVQLDGIEMTANNISSDGMQVSCPEFLFGRLQDTLEQDSFDIDIQLPMIETPCRTSAQMVYNSTFGDEHLLGLKYISLEDEHQQNLSNYLKDLSDKNAPVVED